MLTIWIRQVESRTFSEMPSAACSSFSVRLNSCSSAIACARMHKNDQVNSNSRLQHLSGCGFDIQQMRSTALPCLVMRRRPLPVPLIGQAVAFSTTAHAVQNPRFKSRVRTSFRLA